MAGLTGVSTQGVGSDIVDYLTEVAQFFDITIRVTSGYRSPDKQVHAMWDNWVSLQHGKVYSRATLPETDRVTVDGYWTLAHNPKSSATVKAKAKADFLELTKARVGSKSKHSQGRAIDMSRTHIDRKVHRAITLWLHDVKEGNRTDIYHFESIPLVPAIDEATKTKWEAIKVGTHQSSTTPPHSAHGVCC